MIELSYQFQLDSLMKRVLDSDCLGEISKTESGKKHGKKHKNRALVLIEWNLRTETLNLKLKKNE